MTRKATQNWGQRSGQQEKGQVLNYYMHLRACAHIRLTAPYFSGRYGVAGVPRWARGGLPTDPVAVRRFLCDDQPRSSGIRNPGGQSRRGQAPAERRLHLALRPASRPRGLCRARVIEGHAGGSGVVSLGVGAVRGAASGVGQSGHAPSDWLCSSTRATIGQAPAPQLAGDHLGALSV
jgi:hypothetical protein